MFLFRTNDAGDGAFFFRTNDPDADTVIAAGSGATAAASQATGSAQGWAAVTIAEPIYYGQGSIFHGAGEPWGNFDGTPEAGDVVRFQTHGGFQILPDGTIEADGYGTWECYYDDGEGEQQFLVTLDDSIQVFADAASAATAEAAESEVYGGVNISGDAPDPTVTPAQGGATVGTIASGAGVTTPATAAQGGAAGPANVEGAGVSVDAAAAEGVGEIEVTASGAGVEVTTEAAQGEAAGNVVPEGAGVTVVASAAAASAIGDRLPGSISYAVLTVVYPRNLLIAREQAA